MHYEHAFLFLPGPPFPPRPVNATLFSSSEDDENDKIAHHNSRPAILPSNKEECEKLQLQAIRSLSAASSQAEKSTLVLEPHIVFQYGAHNAGDRQMKKDRLD